MRQLTLLEAEMPTLADFIGTLTSSWSRRAAAPAHLTEARKATGTRFASWQGRPLDGAECERVSAYFAGVMRRRLMRGSDPQTRHARRLLVAATVEADLKAAGWRAESAAAEGRRVAGLAESRGAA